MYSRWMLVLSVIFIGATRTFAEEFPTIPNAYTVDVYLDCGAQDHAEGPGGVSLHTTKGRPYTFPGVDGPMATAVYDDTAVTFEARGLDPGKEYVLALAWWDADAQGRVQSAYMGPVGESPACVLPPAPAQAYYEDKSTWATILLPIPAATINKGALTLEIRTQAGPNAVANALWLLRKTDATPRKRVLIITGDDYPGHRWRETGPELARILREDPRLEVSITESPAILGSPLLKHYDAAMIHFKNYPERLKYGKEIWDGLRAYVDNGGGLLIAHFGCGAFQEWDQFVQVIGRVWNPTFRAHDPYGPFDVRIADPQHPITQGMAPFATTDELYTCLDGAPPIRILCEATSKIDQKPYPMGFVLQPESKRVFHCTLGHDVQALRSEGSRLLYRRAALWAAGIAAP